MKRYKRFKHLNTPLGYDDLKVTYKNSTRLYESPDGDSLYPSVTSVLSILSRDSIAKWRKRVGEVEANKISFKASTRGTAVHEIIEKYIDNVPNYAAAFLPNIRDNFLAVRPLIDKHIDNIYCQEGALYSDHLGLAGRVDCIAEWDGVLSIIDFKTSARLKKLEWVTSYFIQESAYAVMFEERTGIPVTQLVTLIAVDNEEPQVFIEHRDNWTSKLIETIGIYNETTNT
jgi:genome maintenance exonuclease 1